MSMKLHEKLEQRQRELKYRQSSFTAINSDFSDSEENFQRRIDNTTLVIERLRSEVSLKNQQILRELQLVKQMQENRDDPSGQRLVLKKEISQLEREIQALRILELKATLVKLTGELV